MSSACCEPAVPCSPSKWELEEADRKKKDDEMMNTEVVLNGTKLKLNQLFSDCYGAKDFYSKLKLMEATKGGKDMLDTSVSSIMDDSEEEAEA